MAERSRLRCRSGFGRLAPAIGGGSAEFVREFEIDENVESATLRVAVDFCGCRVVLNGHVAAVMEAYDEHLAIDAKSILVAGINELKVEARGVDGPSAVALELVATHVGGDDYRLESSPSWTTSDGKPVAAYGPLASLGWRAPDAVPSITAFDEYNQWMEAKGSEKNAEAVFSMLPPGFEIDLLRVSRDGEDSWVSLAIDTEGRMVIAREKKGMLRMTMADDSASIGMVEVINDELLECRGLLFAHGSLYVNANNSKGLYRLRDTDGDEQFDESVLLRATAGGVGHGRNDLALGPDGMIYAIHGDSVDIPSTAKHQLPQVIPKTRLEGHFVRTDGEGKTWEIVSAGLRNPFGIDFNEDGEPFTYDADNESDMALPFYRPTRVNHLVSGADYGWRKNGASWPVYAADSLPTTLDIGAGSPTAVKFGTRSNFAAKYRKALFILDWAYGRIIAVRPVARGASYSCRAETFLRGRPLNVTDLDFDADGAMVFVTGGRQTRSALYRVRYVGEKDEGRNATAQERARAGFSEGARRLRRQLEDPDGDWEFAWRHLDSPDPWIRHAARVAVERQPVVRWKARALGEPDASKACRALLALARVGPDAALPEVVARVGELSFGKASRDEKLAILRVCGVCLSRGSTIPMARISKIDAAFPDLSAAVNRDEAALLVALKSPTAVGKMLELLSQTEDQPEQLYYLDTLSKAEAGWTSGYRETFFRTLQRARAFGGDKSLPGFVSRIRKRAIAGLDEDERKTYAPLIEWERKSAADPGSPSPTRAVVKHWGVGDLKKPGGSAPDFERGKKAFSDALCVRCHQIASAGTPMGPNLSAVGSRFGRSDLLQSIVSPSMVVAEVFRNHVITMRDGTTLVGRVVRNDFRKSIVTVATNPFDLWQFNEVAKRDIASSAVSDISPMPPGLLDTLTREEIDDLIAYLEAGGDARHPVYRRE